MAFCLRGFLAAGLILHSSAAALGADSKAPHPPCTTVATEADRKAAQGAFAAGQGSFNEADYTTAITYWRDAYRRDCSAHALLLNLARAYELQGDRGEAVNALETYLQRKPDVPEADQIRRRIENLKSQMTASAAPPASASAVPLPAAPPAASSTTAAPVSAGPSSAPVTESGEPSGSRSVAPLFLAGGGGVLVIVGSVVLAGGIKKVNDVEKQCPTRECSDQALTDDGNAGRTQQMLGGAMLGVGLAAAGGGLLWYFLSTPKGDAPAQSGGPFRHAVPRPLLGPGFAGISLAGGF
jgi:tetratricopeptide (TPR) repeat protein